MRPLNAWIRRAGGLARGGRPALTLLATLLALLPGCAEDGPPGDDDPGGQPLVGLDCELPSSQVSWVRDGDTVDVRRPCRDGDDVCGDGACVDGFCDDDLGLRLMAINAGEVLHNGVGTLECMGEDATLAVRRLVQDQDVELVYEPIAGCTEVYDRALAYVWVDGVLVQERLLAEGLACLYWYDNKSQKEQTLYYRRLTLAQERAQKLGLGIWSPERVACGDLPFPERCGK